MGRPPVGNLYDTIPFITAGAVLVLGISEWLTKRRLLLSLGSVLGVAGMFLAFRYEVGDATDHMDPLVAVLKSNYWLATHVVTITIGYSGGLMACLISAVYSHMRLAGFWEQDQSLRRFITRSVYGVTCFTLLFSLVGTVLGGIWANDSWGRFWGWDPKENGALLIVLWCLIILHARLAGWIKEWGLHLLSVLGGAIVGWSWWHVNMLEVGLHSYGFIKGGEVIWLFYGACGFSFLVGFAAWWMEKYFRKKKRDDDSSDLNAQT
jgi:ABC-type transport system involved in cytochrome c biogenesis permease subunit